MSYTRVKTGIKFDKRHLKANTNTPISFSGEHVLFVLNFNVNIRYLYEVINRPF